MDPEQLRAEAAQRWERLVQGGMSKEEARTDTDRWLEHRQRAGVLASEADAFAEEAERETPRPGLFRGLLTAAASGVTLGGLDELRAGVRALPRLVPGGESFGDAYAEDVEATRTGRERFREDHRVMSTVAEIGGAVAPAVASAPLVVGGRATIGLGRLAAAGAAEGAVAGALESEGGVGERAGGAAAGGALGLLAGGLIPAGGRILGRLGGQVLDIANLRPRANSGPVGRLAQRLGVQSVAQRADGRIAQSLPTGQALTDATTQLDAARTPLTMMDADENVRGLARAARGVPGRAKTEIPTFLAQRTAGQEERVINEALRLTGAGHRASIYDTAQEITARRSAAARPLYEEAYAQGQVTMTPALEEVLKKPSIRSAFERAKSIAAEEGVDLGEIGFAEGANSFTLPTVQALDYIKRGLDDVLYVGRQPGPGGLGPSGIKAIRETRRALMNAVEDVTGGPTGAYARARSQFAGDTALLEALDQGRDLWKLDPAEARAILGELTPSEREMFVRGGLESMAARIEDTSSSFDLTRRRPLSDRTRDQQRLRLLFPDDDSFGEFRRIIGEEAQAAHSDRFITGGSNTADKLMELANLAGTDLSNIMSGNVPGMLARIAESSVANRARGYSGDLAAEMIPTLTATGPRGAEQVRRLSAIRSQVGQQLSRREAAVAGTAGALGGVATNRREPDR